MVVSEAIVGITCHEMGAGAIGAGSTLTLTSAVGFLAGTTFQFHELPVELEDVLTGMTVTLGSGFFAGATFQFQPDPPDTEMLDPLIV